MLLAFAICAAIGLLLVASAPLRDANGRIHRSQSAVHRFQVSTGHPNGWPGHVVDHIVPLASGGPDEPINMQWESDAEGKAKDAIERLPAAVALEVQILACRRARTDTIRMAK